MLDKPGEIHIFDDCLAEPGHRHATCSPERSALWRNPWDPGGPVRGQAPCHRVSQSTKIEDPGCWRTLGRICHSRRTAGPPHPTLHYPITTNMR
jgi:hypothetical protein